ncbi:hypothetical protein [Leifsonia kafniensis]
MTLQSELPAVEVWWPHLTIEQKHEIQQDVSAPLSAAVREEIERIANIELSESHLQLSREAQSFIQTQSEPVD